MKRKGWMPSFMESIELSDKPTDLDSKGRNGLYLKSLKFKNIWGIPLLLLYYYCYVLPVGKVKRSWKKS